MWKTPCFVEKFTRVQKTGIWQRKVYSMEGDLLAKGKVKLTRKKFKKPTRHNFELIDKWVYYDTDGLLKKERNYGMNMQAPETMTREVSLGIYISIW